MSSRLRSAWHVWSRLFLAVVFPVLTSACGSSPLLGSSRVTLATNPTGTFLAAVSERSVKTENGVKLIVRPDTALQIRLALIRKAERSVDLQYFIWEHDPSGGEVLAELQRAASRGVRVRLLLDDFYSGSIDGRLAAIATTPNFHVRFFNVMSGPRGSTLLKVVSSLPDLSRARHRMHNKLLLADSAAAIMGGRNIGDEYLTAGRKSFFDLDLLAMGPVVQAMSDSFDEYWNSAHAYDAESVWGASRQRAAASKDLSHLAVGTSASGSHDGDELAREIEAGHINLHACAARVIADPVAKVNGQHLKDSSGTLHASLVRLILNAEHEIAVVSPYFVRGLAGLMRASSLSQRGVRQRVWTNSLSTTDSTLAYVSYRRHRQQLVAAGIEIKEFSPIDGHHGVLATAGTLHAKLAVIDRRFVYVGSLNFTSRSERLNTEIGVILDCPALASDAMSIVELLPGYDVRMGKGEAALTWIDRRSGGEKLWDFDPGATLWQRLQALVLHPLVPDGEI